MKNKSISEKSLGITASILSDIIEREDNGVLTNKSQRFFREKQGKLFGFFGKRKYRDIDVTHYNQLKSKDLANLMSNLKTKYISKSVDEKGEEHLTISDSSVQKRGWLRKQFSKITHGLTHCKEAKEAKQSARDILIKRLNEVIESFEAPQCCSEEAKERFQGTLDKYRDLIKRFIKFEILSYSVGTGRQHLKFHKLIRLSMMVDQLLEFAHLEASKLSLQENNEECDSTVCDKLSDIVATLEKHKRSGGLHVMHNFLSSLSGKLNKLNVEEMSLKKVTCFPRTTDQLISFVAAFNKESAHSIQIPPLLKLDIANTFHELLTHLPTPISSSMKQTLEQNKERLLVALQLGTDAGIFSKELNIVSTHRSGKDVRANDAFAQEMLDLVQKVSQLFEDLAQGKALPTDINSLVAKASWLSKPTLVSLWDYSVSVCDLLHSQVNFLTYNAHQEKYQLPNYNTYVRRLLTLQKASIELKDDSDYNKVLIEHTHNVIERVTQRSENLKYEKVSKIILDEANKVPRKKHRIHCQRVLSGIRKAMFSSSTVASKVVRRISAAASILGTAIAAPIAGAQIAALPTFSNGDWAFITVAQIKSILGHLGIASIPLSVPIAFSASSALMAKCLSDKKNDGLINPLYEDTHHVRSRYGLTLKKLDMYNSIDQSRKLADVESSLSIEVLFDIDTVKNLDVVDCVSKLKEALFSALPITSKTYPSGTISYILDILAQLNKSSCADDRSYIYQGVMTVIMPYLKTLQEPRVREQAYMELQSVLFNDDGTPKEGFRFVKPDESPNERFSDEIVYALREEILQELGAIKRQGTYIPQQGIRHFFST
ncbi:MAG: hypothetical protein K2M30_00625, partial [Desulfovibrionaceae bacterium]|nr:hypothetical protein [Desulfovibrionaceae bacterium]